MPLSMPMSGLAEQFGAQAVGGTVSPAAGKVAPAVKADAKPGAKEAVTNGVSGPKQPPALAPSPPAPSLWARVAGWFKGLFGRA